MDLSKRLAEGANIISAIIAIYLLVKPTGGPGAAQVEQAVNQVPVHAPVNNMLVALCISVFCASVLNFIALRKKPESRPSAIPRENLASGSNNPIAGPTVDIAPLSFGTQTVLPDGRVIVSCAVNDLTTAFRNKTIEQFNKAFCGKWVKLSGEIEDNHGKGTVYIKTGPEDPIMSLQFGNGWEEALSQLSRAEMVTFRGRIGESMRAIRLEGCELL